MKLSLPVVFLIVLGCYVLTASGHLFSPDEELLFRTTRALATQGSLAIEPMPGGFGSRAANPPRADKREYAQYGVGQPLLAVPLYWAGAALSRVGDDAFWRRATAGHDGPLPAAELAPRWACSWFNILLGPWLAIMVGLLARELGVGRQGSTRAALLYALGTLAWPHSRTFFTEPCATFFILVAWWAVLRGLRGRLGPWLVLGGAAAGFAALVRMDSAFAFPALGLILVGPTIAAARSKGQAFWRPWLAFALPAIACGAILLGLNRLHYGGAAQTGYAARPEGVSFRSPFIPGLYGLLFSAGKGLFFFSPVLVLSFLGWRPLAEALREKAPAEPLRRHPWLAWWAVLAAVLIPLFAHAKWPNWAGGWCWGPRHVYLIHPFLALPLAAWLGACRVPAARVATATLMVVGMGVQLLGCSQDFIVFYQRFFRAPVDGRSALVRYDDYDRQYWSGYFQLLYREDPSRQWRPVELYPPAPIQASVFEPAQTAWAGYPTMLSEGMLDNFWANLARRRAEPATATPAAKRP
jgi:hypothetical protein